MDIWTSDSAGVAGDAKAGATAAAKSSARRRGGRLIEVRIGRLGDVEDVLRLGDQVHAALSGTGPGAIVYADHRLASPISREVADAWARSIRGVNRTIAHSAILLDPENTTYNLQIERIVRVTGHAARRIFRSGDELLDWLGRMMTPDEQETLRELLCAEGDR